MSKIYEIIDRHELIGIPFAWGGRDHTLALDCYGLVRFIHSELGNDLPEYITPSRELSRRFVSESSADDDWQPTEDICKTGAVIVFRTLRYLHVGLSIGDGQFVHTWENSGGVCIESIVDWEARIEGVYEFVC